MSEQTVELGLTCITLTKINKQFESKQTFFVRRLTWKLRRNIPTTCKQYKLINIRLTRKDIATLKIYS